MPADPDPLPAGGKRCPRRWRGRAALPIFWLMPFRRSLRGPLLPAVALALCLGAAMPARAFDLFAAHQVTAQFATPDGKPMAHVPVRVFAPGDPLKPVLTGRTDGDGKFTFAADRDGFWSAEARDAGEVARGMIRVGATAPDPARRRDRRSRRAAGGRVLVPAAARALTPPTILASRRIRADRATMRDR